MSDKTCQPSTEPRCGTANRMERIVGGQNTSTKRWPWIVYLTIFRFFFANFFQVQLSSFLKVMENLKSPRIPLFLPH